MSETITWSGYEWLTRHAWGSMHDEPDKRNDSWADPSQLRVTNTGVLQLNIGYNPKTIIINGKPTTAHYGVGTITSIVKFGYGVYTISAKMPIGVGLWSAFWMYDNCCPEIDFEMYSHRGNYVNGLLRRVAAETCVHTEPGLGLKPFPARAPWIWQYGNEHIDMRFCTYTIRWTADSMEWFIDGNRVRKLRDREILRYLQGRKMTVIVNTYIDGRYQAEFSINSPMEVGYFKYLPI